MPFIKVLYPGLLLLFSIELAYADKGDRTLTIGYASNIFKKSSDDFLTTGVGNKTIHGINLKHFYEASDRFGYVFSVVYGKNSTSRRSTSGRKYNFDNNYFNISAGPTWRVTNWLSLYSTVGLSTLQSHAEHYSPDIVRKTRKFRKKYLRRGGRTLSHIASDYGVVAGIGMQFKVTDKFVLDTSMEQAWLRNNRINTWIFGAGYTF